ncbi:hypothetical protein [Nocardia gamkensis]|uniref:Uncharacterized protein n=1 Tax=Nocardia gamkensis TaxID=352869 RepID=A0A7X6L3V8_9NOCA|nr:hypothetical protein [Nocardia gamkensis]NKY27267.1 hypothetical protein [Nocardia gamkensis]NQE65791.1 hypothetical protein [Nocardia gamkensis]
MEKHEPSVEELTESVIRAGTESGYQISRDDTGRLQITAIDESPVEPPLTFAVTDQELHDYYLRLAANTGKPVGAGTPWKTWMLLMATHLDEAVYKAGVLNQPCVITIGETGFWPVPR